MLLIALLLIILWAIGFFAFTEVAGAFIHILLIFALISFIAGLFRRREEI